MQMILHRLGKAMLLAVMAINVLTTRLVLQAISAPRNLYGNAVRVNSLGRATVSLLRHHVNCRGRDDEIHRDIDAVSHDHQRLYLIGGKHIAISKGAGKAKAQLTFFHQSASLLTSGSSEDLNCGCVRSTKIVL